MSISEAIQAFLDNKLHLRRVAVSSARTYAAHLRRFTLVVGPQADLDAALARAEAYILELSKRGRSDHYVRKAFFVLRDLGKWSRAKGHAQLSALEDLDAPMLHDKPKVFIPEPGVMSFLETVRGSGRRLARRDHALFATLYFSWLRVSEACRSRPEDYDLARCLVRVFGKGGKELLIPFDPLLAPILRDYLRRHRPAPSSLMFPSQQHEGGACGSLGMVRVQYLMREVYGPLAGLPPGASPHALRRSGGDHAYRRGADLRDIQQVYRHAQITTTMGYLGVSTPDQLRGVWKRAS